MTDFILHTKAILVTSSAMFILLWCVNGLADALLVSLYTIAFLLGTAGILAVITTLTFMFYDWKNERNEKANSA